MDALPFLPFFDLPVKLPAGDFTANIVAELRLSIARNGRNPDQYLDQLDHFERLRHSMLQILSQPPHADTADVLTSYTAQMFSIVKRFADITFEHNAWTTMTGKTIRDSEPWYELAVTSWNLAAFTSTISQMKLFEDSEDDSSIKAACSGFQVAGWKYYKKKYF